jgi:hypothetical protein
MYGINTMEETMPRNPNKPTPPLERHKDCQIEIRPSTSMHYASYYCLDCSKHIAWLTQSQAILADRMGLLKGDRNSV